MKKGILSIILACVLSFTLCGCNKQNEHISGEVKEIMTVEALVEFYEHGAKYPDGFLFKELEGYGRILFSASSREEAISIAEDNFNSVLCSKL